MSNSGIQTSLFGAAKDSLILKAIAFANPLTGLQGGQAEAAARARTRRDTWNSSMDTAKQ